MKPSVAIVTMIKGMGNMLDSFIRYHQHIGIGRIYLILDDPHDPVQTIAHAHAPFVKVIPNDAALRARWRQAKVPAAKEADRLHQTLADRQGLNTAVVLEMCEEEGIDWLLHLDGDELFYSAAFFGDDKLTAGDIFAKLEKKGIHNVTFLNHEAVAHSDTIGDPFKETRLFKRNRGTLPNHRPNRQQQQLLGQLQHPGSRYFLGYQKGKSAAKVASKPRSADTHIFYLPEQYSRSGQLINNIFSNNRVAAKLNKIGVFNRIRNRLLAPQLKRWVTSTNPVILHFPFAGFETFHQRYVACPPNQREGGLNKRSFNYIAYEAVGKGDDAALDFYRQHIMIADEALLAEMQANDLILEITEPADLLTTLS